MPLCTGYHDGENMYPPPKFRQVFAAGAMAGIRLRRPSLRE